jgi:prepilin-type N-terminal cleavage/methylation domain-containing protein
MGYHYGMGKKGFTLIEVTLVIVVLGILAALYTSSTGDISDVSIDAVSRKVQSDIRHAHHLSTTTGTNHGVLFTPGVGYEVYVGSPGNYAKDPVTRQDFIVDITGFEGVDIDQIRQVEFNSIGEPVMGGDSRIRLESSSGAIRDVYVIDKTGAVVIDLIEYGTGCSCQLCFEKD